MLPRLAEAGWARDQIIDQFPITDGRVITTGHRPRRAEALWADYALEYTPGVQIAVVEAKREFKKPGDGMQQAKKYAPKVTLSPEGIGVKLYQQEPLELHDEIWAAGHVTPQQLLRIAAWKSARGLAELSLNPEDAIFERTQAVVEILRPMQSLDVMHDRVSWDEWEAVVGHAIGSQKQKTGLLSPEWGWVSGGYRRPRDTRSRGVSRDGSMDGPGDLRSAPVGARVQEARIPCVYAASRRTRFEPLSGVSDHSRSRSEGYE